MGFTEEERNAATVAAITGSALNRPLGPSAGEAEPTGVRGPIAFDRSPDRSDEHERALGSEPRKPELLGVGIW